MSHYILGKIILLLLTALLIGGFFVLILLAKKQRFVLFGFLAFAMAIGSYARWIEPNQIVVREVELPYSFEEPVRVALLADFHLGAYSCAVDVTRWVGFLNESDADVALIAGDFVWGVKDRNQLRDWLAPLAEVTVPLYAVLGNHDLPSQGELPADDIVAELEALGVTMIDDTATTISVGQNSLQLVGLGDYWNTEYDRKVIENLDPNELTLLLTHNPDRIHDVHIPQSIDLALAGHTHGGQVWTPAFIRHYIIPTRNDFFRGLSLANGIPTYVTSGLGTGGLPLRIGVKPEVVVFVFGG